jgi:hypothetical protein
MTDYPSGANALPVICARRDPGSRGAGQRHRRIDVAGGPPAPMKAVFCTSVRRAVQRPPLNRGSSGAVCK